MDLVKGNPSMKSLFLGKKKDKGGTDSENNTPRSGLSSPLSSSFTGAVASPSPSRENSAGNLYPPEPSPHRKGSAELTPREELWQAINDGELEVAISLLDQHPEYIHDKDESGMTPLHVACKGGLSKLPLCDMLLNRGADVTIETVNGTSALHYLVSNIPKEDPRINDILLKMLDLGADVNRRSAQGETALHYACSGRCTPQVINFLIQYGAEINSIDTRGYTPLHLSILQKKHENVKILLNKGASLTTFSKQGSCLELAKKDEEILELLWTAGFGEFLNPSWSPAKRKRFAHIVAKSDSFGNRDQGGLAALQEVIGSAHASFSEVRSELLELVRVAQTQPATPEAWAEVQKRAETALRLASGALKNFAKEKKESEKVSAALCGGVKYDEFSDLQAFDICEGFHYNNYDIFEHDQLQFAIPFSEITFYKTYFFDKEHQNFVGNHSTLGTIIISIVREPAAFRFLVRSKFGDARVLIPSVRLGSSSKKISSFKLLTSCNPLLSHVIFRNVENKDFNTNLLQFEAAMMSKQLKFGVLLAHEGQTDEASMFANDSHPLFDEFLALLGDTIKLEGWPHYSGGLDVKTNLTGTHSVYTQHEGWEIMYHVSTMLPKSDVDEQQIERKKHLGNDICLLVFNTGKTPYNPKMIRTQFIHIIVVVQVAELNPDGTAAKYRVEVAFNSIVPPFQPMLRSPPIYSKAKIREVVLSKLINGEVTSRLDNVGFFAKKMRKPRLQMLEELLKKA